MRVLTTVVHNIMLLGLILVMACTPTQGAEKIAEASPENFSEIGSETTAATPLLENDNMKKAMFGAGCFWGVEATFRAVPGVIEAYSGYSGGRVDNPTYKQVCSGNTGHAEVVEVTYDPEKVSYEKLLEVFWNCHNPTHVNRQGVDVGDQYRTAIYYYDEEQKAAAEKTKADLAASGEYDKPIATEVSAAQTFYKAEEYHQRYLEKHGLVNCHVPEK